MSTPLTLLPGIDETVVDFTRRVLADGFVPCFRSKSGPDRVVGMKPGEIPAGWLPMRVLLREEEAS